MVDVDDEIADLEIAQIGQERLPGTAAARAPGVPPRRRRPPRRSAGRHRAAGIRATDGRRRPAQRRTAHLRAFDRHRRSSYSFSTSIVRSARPGVAATNRTASPSSRSRLISATQSPTRPCIGVAVDIAQAGGQGQSFRRILRKMDRAIPVLPTEWLFRGASRYPTSRQRAPLTTTRDRRGQPPRRNSVSVVHEACRAPSAPRPTLRR